MDAAERAIIEALWQGVKVWAATPEGKRAVAQIEAWALNQIPGWEGAALRLIAAALPHDVESIGFKKDGPG